MDIDKTHIKKIIVCLAFAAALLLAISLFSCGKSESESEPVKTTNFTIPEGKTVKETMKILVEQGLTTEGEFMDEVKNGDFDYDFLKDEKNLGNGESRLEGYLFPDTYEIYEGESAHGIIDRMLANFDVKLKEAESSGSGRDLRENLILASIIEMETAKDSERPLVASVFVNRIADGMKLQSCTTVEYVLGKHKDILSYEDIAVDSPYNTYKYEGLPAGPICSPALASLKAAFSPADTKYYYFVASSKHDGSNVFCETEGEFFTAKEKYEESLKG